MDQVEKAPSTPESPPWKLYDNPHYTNRNNITINKFPQNHRPYTCLSNSRSSYKTHTIASFSNQINSDRDVDLSDLDNALSEIKELRAELEFERRMRKKMESVNKLLTKELAEEKRARAEAESDREKLGMEIKHVREDFEKAMKEAEDERRMLRMAEAMREERVQMKLTEARFLMEEKIKEMTPVKNANLKTKVNENQIENPHIRRGIKGMEFPKTVRGRNGNAGVYSPNSKANLECQRAQLSILMRNRNGGVGNNENLVM